MDTHTDPTILIASLVKKGLPGENLKYLTDNPESLDIRQCGEGGSMNQIFTVRSADGKSSVIIKHGTEVPLAEGLSGLCIPMGRQELEYECLKELHCILPGCVPEPYYWDKELQFILMEDLSGMDLLSSCLRNGENDIKIATEIGRVLSKIQLKTHKNLVSPLTWRRYQETLRHAGVRDVIFHLRTDGILDGGPFLEVREEFASHVKDWSTEIKETKLFEKLREMFNREDCFVHLDLHHHSVFVKEDRVAMFDLEIGGLGNHAFSIGYLSAFYVFSMIEVEEKGTERKEGIRGKTKHAFHTLYSAFISGFGDSVNVLGPLSTFMCEASMFLGSVLFSYPISTNHATFFTISAMKRRRLAELGLELMRHWTKHNSIEKLIETIFSYV